jgi:hypothetical protein
MYCPNLHDLLLRFRPLTTGRGSSPMEGLLPERDPALRMTEESAPAPDPHRLDASNQMDSPLTTRPRRFI